MVDASHTFFAVVAPSKHITTPLCVKDQDQRILLDCTVFVWLQHLESQLSVAQNSLSAAHSQLAAVNRNLDEALRQNQALLVEAAAAKASSDATADLQDELSHAREGTAAATAEAASWRQECDALRAALRAVESRLVEYQRKDAQVMLVDVVI